jgi:hypothetical protein
MVCYARSVAIFMLEQASTLAARRRGLNDKNNMCLARLPEKNINISVSIKKVAHNDNVVSAARLF